MNRTEQRKLKRMARMATLIARRLARGSGSTAAAFPELVPLGTLMHTHRLSERAASLGFENAGRRLERERNALLHRIRHQIEAYLHAMEEPTSPIVPCDDKLLIAELAAVEAEFAGIELDCRRRTVSVVTPEIELDGVCLGRFRICLEVRALGESQPYRVIALDPECARDCDDTTHPHVQGEHLCEGEGAKPIRHALDEGRILDFFTIVRQVLQTYNPNSAYTQLSDWFGVECGDCGCTVERDDCSSCDRCDAKTCGDCSTSCADCDRTVCGSCSESCESCGQRSCDACLSECRECDKPFCKDCLNQEICDECTEKESEATEKAPECPPAASV